MMGVVCGESGQHGGDLRRNWRWSRQVSSSGHESVLIGGPTQRDFLSFGRDVVRGSLIGVARLVSDDLLLVGFGAGCAIWTGVAVRSKAK